jgi:hypothetical protein
MSALDAIRGKTPTIAGDQTPRWPNQGDVTLAEKYNYTYGDRADAVVGPNGRIKTTDNRVAMRELNKDDGPDFMDKTRPISRQQSDDLMAAKLAADKSPIAALGMDLTRLQYSPPGAGPSLSARGAFSASKDVMWADGANPSAVVHESIHRGMNELRKANPDKFEKIRDGIKEEILTRALMLKYYGDVEVPGTDKTIVQSQIDPARRVLKTHSKIFDELEMMAQEEIKNRKPMGPR